MLPESPSCVLRLGWVCVKPNVVVPGEVMHGGFVRWDRKRLREGLVVGVIPNRARVSL